MTLKQSEMDLQIENGNLKSDLENYKANFTKLKEHLKKNEEAFLELQTEFQSNINYWSNWQHEKDSLNDEIIRV